MTDNKKRKSKVITISIPTEFLEFLKTKSNQDKRSLSSFIVVALMHTFKYNPIENNLFIKE